MADMVTPVPFHRHSAPKGYVCYRACHPLLVDGTLSDSAWDAAEWTDDFVDIEGDSQPQPRFCTRAKMLWNDRYFYVGGERRRDRLR